MSFPQSAIVEKGESDAASVREGRYNITRGKSLHILESQSVIPFTYLIRIYKYLTPLTLTIVCEKRDTGIKCRHLLIYAWRSLIFRPPPQQRKEILPLLL